MVGIVIIKHFDHILDVLSPPQKQRNNGQSIVLAEREELAADGVAAHRCISVIGIMRV